MEILSPICRNVIAPAWAFWERSPYLSEYRVLTRSQYDDPGMIAERQRDKLVRLLHHAYRTVPYYRRRFDDARFRPEDVRSLEDLRHAPLLSKADLRSAGCEMLSDDYRARADLSRKNTSGSTGVSLEVFVDEPAMQFKRACTLRSDEWSGWRLGERVAMIWGNPGYLNQGWKGRLRNAILDRRQYLDTLKMDKQAMERYVDQLIRRPPSLIFGHAHSVHLFALFVKQYRPGSIRPKGIITSAMVLHQWQRQLIEEVFGCRVTNRYGCEEVSLIACECEQHEGLHVNSDGQYVELLRDGRPVPPGEPGSVVVTDLVNQAMPLIRYQVGDVAVWADGPCSCGRRGMPLIKRLEGREADYVTTPRGDLISGISLTENFALQVPGIEQLQIIQESLREFVFRIVRSDEFGAHSEQALRAAVAARFGPDVSYSCEFVDRIPQEPSGKYRFCISKVPNPFIVQASTSPECL